MDYAFSPSEFKISHWVLQTGYFVFSKAVKKGPCRQDAALPFSL